MLELKNLSFVVEEDGGKKEILHDLNLLVEDRKLVVITDPIRQRRRTTGAAVPFFAETELFSCAEHRMVVF